MYERCFYEAIDSFLVARFLDRFFYLIFGLKFLLFVIVSMSQKVSFILRKLVLFLCCRCELIFHSWPFPLLYPDSWVRKRDDTRPKDDDLFHNHLISPNRNPSDTIPIVLCPLLSLYHIISTKNFSYKTSI